jgi:hypothetical protein
MKRFVPLVAISAVGLGLAAGGTALIMKKRGHLDMRHTWRRMEKKMKQAKKKTASALKSDVPASSIPQMREG